MLKSHQFHLISKMRLLSLEFFFQNTAMFHLRRSKPNYWKSTLKIKEDSQTTFVFFRISELFNAIGPITDFFNHLHLNKVN